MPVILLQSDWQREAARALPVKLRQSSIPPGGRRLRTPSPGSPKILPRCTHRSRPCLCRDPRTRKITTLAQFFLSRTCRAPKAPLYITCSSVPGSTLPFELPQLFSLLPSSYGGTWYGTNYLPHRCRHPQLLRSHGAGECAVGLVLHAE